MELNFRFKNSVIYVPTTYPSYDEFWVWSNFSNLYLNYGKWNTFSIVLLSDMLLDPVWHITFGTTAFLDSQTHKLIIYLEVHISATVWLVAFMSIIHLEGLLLTYRCYYYLTCSLSWLKALITCMTLVLLLLHPTYVIILFKSKSRRHFSHSYTFHIFSELFWLPI